MRRSLPPHLLWPGFVIGLLLLGMASTFWLVASAQSDGGVTPVAEYHDVRDVPEHVAIRQASAALGWVVTGRAVGSSVLLLVQDPAGVPVEGLAGTVVVSRPHLAAALDTLDFTETVPGTYAVALGEAEPGLWDFTFDALIDSHHFVGSTRLSLP